MLKIRWLMILLLATLVLASCARGDTVTAEQIMAGMTQARETTQSARAVVDISLSGSQQDAQALVEVWMRKSDRTDATGKPIPQLRARVLESSRSELVGSELVNDGRAVALWNPAANTAITGNVDDLKAGHVGAQDPMAQMLRMQEQLQQLLDGSNVVVVAENDPVAGMAAWKVRLTPKPELAEQMRLGSAIEVNLWVGHERYVPLKAVVSASEFGRGEVAVTEIELDQPIDPALFTFTPPPGARVIDAAELTRQARPATTTLESARSAASFPVLAPATLPDGVVLDEVQTLRMGGETVIQNYSGSLAFSLVQTRGDGSPDGRQAPLGATSQTVTVRGQEGTLITGSGAQQGSMLRWQEDGVTIIIAGTLSAEDALAIAAALE
jgi:outer membrane lipoprotein-sorting protein